MPVTLDVTNNVTIIVHLSRYVCCCMKQMPLELDSVIMIIAAVIHQHPGRSQTNTVGIFLDLSYRYNTMAADARSQTISNHDIDFDLFPVSVTEVLIILTTHGVSAVYPIKYAHGSFCLILLNIYYQFLVKTWNPFCAFALAAFLRECSPSVANWRLMLPADRKANWSGQQETRLGMQASGRRIVAPMFVK